jgi:PAS domain S-box-containing protein
MSEDIIRLQERIKELELENLHLKENQISVNQAKELYLKIFEDFPALIWRSGLDKLCNYFNRTWLEFTGRTMEEEYGNGWAEGVHPDDFQFCLDSYVVAFDKREAFLMEYRLKNKFGEYRWIRDFGRPFYDLDNTFLGYIGSCYDITDSKHNEQRLEILNTAKDKFFSIVSHDLKNPFNSILGYLDLLTENMDKYDSVKIKKIVFSIQEVAENAYALLENLLLWINSQKGLITYNPVKLNFNALVFESLSLVSAGANLKEITIANNLADDVEIYSDAEMIKTAIRNILTNAIKFTGSGGKIEVSSQSSNQNIVLSITDSGRGMNQQTIDRLFKIGENKSQVGTNGEKGTGLGLILSKEFIEQNEGNIKVSSELCKGSTFEITIPLSQKRKLPGS